MRKEYIRKLKRYKALKRNGDLTAARNLKKDINHTYLNANHPLSSPVTEFIIHEDNSVNAHSVFIDLVDYVDSNFAVNDNFINRIKSYYKMAAMDENQYPGLFDDIIRLPRIVNGDSTVDDIFNTLMGYIGEYVQNEDEYITGSAHCLLLLHLLADSIRMAESGDLQFVFKNGDLETIYPLNLSNKERLTSYFRLYDTVVTYICRNIRYIVDQEERLANMGEIADEWENSFISFLRTMRSDNSYSRPLRESDGDKPPMVYIAGDLLNKGSIICRNEEKAKCLEIGLRTYNPSDDKEINDKRVQTEETNNRLAEKIVRKDSDGLLQSDIIVIEPVAHALGTHIELGQVLGMKDMAAMIFDAIGEGALFNRDAKETVDIISKMCRGMLNKKVYAHLDDIRVTDIPEVGYRRSFSVNQYTHGVVLKLTQGEGFLSLDEIYKRLEKDFEAWKETKECME